MTIELANEIIKLCIDTRGAEITGVTANGKRRMWAPCEKWRHSAPVLFPVCGHFGVVEHGKRYGMPPHGFASESEFAVIARGADFVSLELTDSAATRKVYPYSFRFTVSYSIKGNSLTVEYAVRARQANEPVRFCIGGHESYALDGDLSEYKIVFPHAEKLVHLPHDEGGYLTGQTVDLGTSDTFVLTHEFLDNGATVIFGGIKSDEVSLFHGEKRVAQVTLGGLENLLLWSPDGSNTVCIEPWSNLPDMSPTDNTEFEQKHGVLQASVGNGYVLRRVITYY